VNEYELAARHLADALLLHATGAAESDLCVVIVVAPTSEAAGKRVHAFMRTNLRDAGAIRMLRGYVEGWEALK
jgi:hypothetical protein